MNNAVVHLSILFGIFLGFVWAWKYYKDTMECSTSIIESHDNREGGLSSPLVSNKSSEKDEEKSPEDIQASIDTISKAIDVGAKSFLWQEYRYLAYFMAMMSVLLMVFLGTQPSAAADTTDPWVKAVLSTVAFLWGGCTSIVSGYVGMYIAVEANYRTTIKAYQSCGQDAPFGAPFETSFKAGGVMGFALVALALLNLYILVCVFSLFFDMNSASEVAAMFECVAGYGFGGSSIALFGRVGGGIYTKAADVGADQCKLEIRDENGEMMEGLKEDDPRNPAVIADNVGDNVGDIAGMGADLFGSFAESSCAAMVVSSTAVDLYSDWGVQCFPMILASFGIFTCFVTSFFATHCFRVKTAEDVESSLKRQLYVSTVIMTPLAIIAAVTVFPSSFDISTATNVQDWHIAVCVICGLWSGLAIGLITEYFTSGSYKPTQELSYASGKGAATNIIYGLALGYDSVVIPVFCLAITIYISYSLAAMYGVACGALGILSTLCTGLTIDAYGPICDNAGGIAEMCNMPEEVREITDALDAAGNTTAAVGKGFAIGSAAMVSLALFGAFVTTVTESDTDVPTVDILDPWVFAGLLVGAMMPYWFSAMTMKSVGEAAGKMVDEVRRQIMELHLLSDEMTTDPTTGQQVPVAQTPEYAKCVAISTDASLKEMIAPGALVILTPLLVGYLLGVKCLAGLLSGILVSGVQMAISASNSGGAWDNAKKLVEANKLSQLKWDEQSKQIEQGARKMKNGEDVEFMEKFMSTYKAQDFTTAYSIWNSHKISVVIGDTVGDPMKDTSGPSINILVKLSAITSLVFCPSMASSWEDPGLLESLFS